MTDTSEAEIAPQTNGISEDIDENDRAKNRPADIDADVREMERRKRVEIIMNSKMFREELERIIEVQLRDGSGTTGLMQQISDMMGVSKNAGNVFKNSNCVVPINDIRGIEAMGYAKGEKILRCKLAAVYRLIDLYGWTQGTSNLITARLNQDEEHFLVNPYGMLFHEITASSLIKADMQGTVVEQGTTNFSINLCAYSLHTAIHSARPDIKCIIHVHTPSVVAISALKCGLLPISQESVVIGDVSTHAYIGGLNDPEERDKIARNLGPNNKVLLLNNQGAVCCGETIEEAFFNARNTVLASESQLKLMPVGIDNLVLLTDETRKKMYEAAHKAPESTPRPDQPSILEAKIERKWRVGGVDFEALMRMLDNAGFRTGYIYRHPLVKGEPPRPRNDVEVPPAVSSLGYLLEEGELYKQGLWKKLEGGRKGNDRTRWLNSPNVYQKVEILETGTPDPKKITKWVTDESPTHSSTPVKIESALQFVPKNTNPKEFKKLQQQIKDYRRADKISAGPQSHILEGVTWEEARKMQDAGVTQTGDQVVLMGAASKGIIQRGYQHNATMYKSPYAKNPFDSITDEDIDEYKKVVEKKTKGEYDTDFSESEGLSSAQINKRISDIRSPTSAASETEEESRDEPQVLRIEMKHAPKPSQPEVVLSDDIHLRNPLPPTGRSNTNSMKSCIAVKSCTKQARPRPAAAYYRTNSFSGFPKGSYTAPHPQHFHFAQSHPLCTSRVIEEETNIDLTKTNSSINMASQTCYVTDNLRFNLEQSSHSSSMESLCHCPHCVNDICINNTMYVTVDDSIYNAQSNTEFYTPNEQLSATKNNIEIELQESVGLNKVAVDHIKVDTKICTDEVEDYSRIGTNYIDVTAGKKVVVDLNSCYYQNKTDSDVQETEIAFLNGYCMQLDENQDTRIDNRDLIDSGRSNIQNNNICSPTGAKGSFSVVEVVTTDVASGGFVLVDGCSGTKSDDQDETQLNNSQLAHSSRSNVENFDPTGANGSFSVVQEIITSDVTPNTDDLVLVDGCRGTNSDNYDKTEANDSERIHSSSTNVENTNVLSPTCTEGGFFVVREISTLDVSPTKDDYLLSDSDSSTDSEYESMKQAPHVLNVTYSLDSGDHSDLEELDEQLNIQLDNLTTVTNDGLSVQSKTHSGELDGGGAVPWVYLEGTRDGENYSVSDDAGGMTDSTEQPTNQRYVVRRRDAHSVDVTLNLKLLKLKPAQTKNTTNDTVTNKASTACDESLRRPVVESVENKKLSKLQRFKNAFKTFSSKQLHSQNHHNSSPKSSNQPDTHATENNHNSSSKTSDFVDKDDRKTSNCQKLDLFNNEAPRINNCPIHYSSRSTFSDNQDQKTDLNDSSNITSHASTPQNLDIDKIDQKSPNNQSEASNNITHAFEIVSFFGPNTENKSKDLKNQQHFLDNAPASMKVEDKDSNITKKNSLKPFKNLGLDLVDKSDSTRTSEIVIEGGALLTKEKLEIPKTSSMAKEASKCDSQKNKKVSNGAGGSKCEANKGEPVLKPKGASKSDAKNVETCLNRNEVLKCEANNEKTVLKAKGASKCDAKNMKTGLNATGSSKCEANNEEIVLNGKATKCDAKNMKTGLIGTGGSKCEPNKAETVLKTKGAKYDGQNVKTDLNGNGGAKCEGDKEKTVFNAKVASKVDTKNTKTGLNGTEGSKCETNKEKTGLNAKGATKCDTKNIKIGLNGTGGSKCEANKAETVLKAKGASKPDAKNVKTFLNDNPALKNDETVLINTARHTPEAVNKTHNSKLLSSQRLDINDSMISKTKQIKSSSKDVIKTSKGNKNDLFGDRSLKIVKEDGKTLETVQKTFGNEENVLNNDGDSKCEAKNDNEVRICEANNVEIVLIADYDAKCEAKKEEAALNDRRASKCDGKNEETVLNDDGGSKREVENTVTVLNDNEVLKCEAKHEKTVLNDKEDSKHDANAVEAGLNDSGGSKCEAKHEETVLFDNGASKCEAKNEETVLNDNEDSKHDAKEVEAGLNDNGGLKNEVKPKETCLLDNEATKCEANNEKFVLNDNEDSKYDAKKEEAGLDDNNSEAKHDETVLKDNEASKCGAKNVEAGSNDNRCSKYEAKRNETVLNDSEASKYEAINEETVLNDNEDTKYDAKKEEADLNDNSGLKSDVKHDKTVLKDNGASKCGSKNEEASLNDNGGSIYEAMHQKAVLNDNEASKCEANNEKTVLYDNEDSKYGSKKTERGLNDNGGLNSEAKHDEPDEASKCGAKKEEAGLNDNGGSKCKAKHEETALNSDGSSESEANYDNGALKFESTNEEMILNENGCSKSEVKNEDPDLSDGGASKCKVKTEESVLVDTRLIKDESDNILDVDGGHNSKLLSSETLVIEISMTSKNEQLKSSSKQTVKTSKNKKSDLHASRISRGRKCEAKNEETVMNDNRGSKYEAKKEDIVLNDNTGLTCEAKRKETILTDGGALQKESKKVGGSNEVRNLNLRTTKTVDIEDSTKSKSKQLETSLKQSNTFSKQSKSSTKKSKTSNKHVFKTAVNKNMVWFGNGHSRNKDGHQTFIIPDKTVQQPSVNEEIVLNHNGGSKCEAKNEETVSIHNLHIKTEEEPDHDEQIVRKASEHAKTVFTDNRGSKCEAEKEETVVIDDGAFQQESEILEDANEEHNLNLTFEIEDSIKSKNKLRKTSIKHKKTSFKPSKSSIKQSKTTSKRAHKPLINKNSGLCRVKNEEEAKKISITCDIIVRKASVNEVTNLKDIGSLKFEAKNEETVLIDNSPLNNEEESGQTVKDIQAASVNNETVLNDNVVSKYETKNEQTGLINKPKPDLETEYMLKHSGKKEQYGCEVNGATKEGNHEESEDKTNSKALTSLELEAQYHLKYSGSKQQEINDATKNTHEECEANTVGSLNVDVNIGPQASDIEAEYHLKHSESKQNDVLEVNGATKKDTNEECKAAKGVAVDGNARHVTSKRLDIEAEDQLKVQRENVTNNENLYTFKVNQPVLIDTDVWKNPIKKSSRATVSRVLDFDGRFVLKTSRNEVGRPSNEDVCGLFLNSPQKIACVGVTKSLQAKQPILIDDGRCRNATRTFVRHREKPSISRLEKIKMKTTSNKLRDILLRNPSLKHQTVNVETVKSNKDGHLNGDGAFKAEEILSSTSSNAVDENCWKNEQSFVKNRVLRYEAKRKEEIVLKANEDSKYDAKKEEVGFKNNGGLKSEAKHHEIVLKNNEALRCDKASADVSSDNNVGMKNVDKFKPSGNQYLLEDEKDYLLWLSNSTLRSGIVNNSGLKKSKNKQGLLLLDTETVSNVVEDQQVIDNSNNYQTDLLDDEKVFSSIPLKVYNKQGVLCLAKETTKETDCKDIEVHQGENNHQTDFIYDEEFGTGSNIEDQKDLKTSKNYQTDDDGELSSIQSGAGPKNIEDQTSKNYQPDDHGELSSIKSRDLDRTGLESSKNEQLNVSGAASEEMHMLHLRWCKDLKRLLLQRLSDEAMWAISTNNETSTNYKSDLIDDEEGCGFVPLNTSVSSVINNNRHSVLFAARKLEPVKYIEDQQVLKTNINNQTDSMDDREKLKATPARVFDTTGSKNKHAINIGHVTKNNEDQQVSNTSLIPSIVVGIQSSKTTPAKEFGAASRNLEGRTIQQTSETNQIGLFDNCTSNKQVGQASNTDEDGNFLVSTSKNGFDNRSSNWNNWASNKLVGQASNTDEDGNLLFSTSKNVFDNRSSNWNNWASNKLLGQASNTDEDGNLLASTSNNVFDNRSSNFDVRNNAGKKYRLPAGYQKVVDDTEQNKTGLFDNWASKQVGQASNTDKDGNLLPSISETIFNNESHCEISNIDGNWVPSSHQKIFDNSLSKNNSIEELVSSSSDFHENHHIEENEDSWGFSPLQNLQSSGLLQRAEKIIADIIQSDEYKSKMVFKPSSPKLQTNLDCSSETEKFFHDSQSSYIKMKLLERIEEHNLKRIEECIMKAYQSDDDEDVGVHSPPIETEDVVGNRSSRKRKIWNGTEDGVYNISGLFNGETLETSFRGRDRKYRRITKSNWISKLHTQAQMKRSTRNYIRLLRNLQYSVNENDISSIKNFDDNPATVLGSLRNSSPILQVSTDLMSEKHDDDDVVTIGTQTNYLITPNTTRTVVIIKDTVVEKDSNSSKSNESVIVIEDSPTTSSIVMNEEISNLDEREVFKSSQSLVIVGDTSDNSIRMNSQYIEDKNLGEVASNYTSNESIIAISDDACANESIEKTGEYITIISSGGTYEKEAPCLKFIIKNNEQSRFSATDSTTSFRTIDETATTNKTKSKSIILINDSEPNISICESYETTNNNSDVEAQQGSINSLTLSEIDIAVPPTQIEFIQQMSDIIVQFLQENLLQKSDLIVFPVITKDDNIKVLFTELNKLYSQNSFSIAQKSELCIEITSEVIKQLRMRDNETISDYLSELLDTFFTSYDDNDFSAFSSGLEQQSTPEKPEKPENPEEDPPHDLSVFQTKRLHSGNEFYWLSINKSPRPSTPATTTTKRIINVDDIPLRPPPDLHHLHARKLSPVLEESRRRLFTHNSVFNEVQFVRSNTAAGSYVQSDNISFLKTDDSQHCDDSSSEKENENEGNWMGYASAKF